MMSAIYYQMVQQKTKKKSHTHWGRRVDCVAERRKEKINGVKGMWRIKCMPISVQFLCKIKIFQNKSWGGEQKKLKRHL